MEDAPWVEWAGKPLTARGLARILGRYEIKPKTGRFPGHETTVRGYQREQFVDAWNRYVSPEGAFKRNKRNSGLTKLVTDSFETQREQPALHLESADFPLNQADVADVALKSGDI